MTAFNIVRFKVKPGHQQQFISKHRGVSFGAKGFRGGHLVQTGEQTFCVIGEWSGMDALAKARPQMIGILDTLREHLEDMGNGMGVTDPVSGQVATKLAMKKAKKKSPAKKKAAKRKKRR